MDVKIKTRLTLKRSSWEKTLGYIKFCEKSMTSKEN